MKADWIRGLRARGLDFAFFLGQSFEPRSARFEERRRPPLVRAVLDGSWTNDVTPFIAAILIIIGPYTEPSFIDGWFSFRDLLAAGYVGILLILWTMTLFDGFSKFMAVWRGYKGIIERDTEWYTITTWTVFLCSRKMDGGFEKKYTINFDTTRRRPRLIPWKHQKGTLQWFRRATKISYVCDAFGSSRYHRHTTLWCAVPLSVNWIPGLEQSKIDTAASGTGTNCGS